MRNLQRFLYQPEFFVFMVYAGPRVIIFVLYDVSVPLVAIYYKSLYTNLVKCSDPAAPSAPERQPASARDVKLGFGGPLCPTGCSKFINKTMTAGCMLNI